MVLSFRWTEQELFCSSRVLPSLSSKLFKGQTCLYRKDNSSQRSERHQNFNACYQDYTSIVPHLSGTGIWTCFPFSYRIIFPLIILFTRLRLALGPTNSCPTTVHTKPFSTSAFQALLGIFATTTKICTHICSRDKLLSRWAQIYQPSYLGPILLGAPDSYKLA